MQTQTFNFPLKGINRAFARSNQPQDTAFDMLNFLPFDRTDRLRGGKRCGTAKLWALPLAADSVLLLDQTTLQSPGSTDDTDPSFTEAFTYSNGDLATASGNAWSVYEVSTGSPTTVMVVFSHVCVTPKQSAGNVAEPIAFRTTPPVYDQGGGYSLEADITLFEKDGISVLSQSQFAFILETDITTLYAASFSMQVTVSADLGSPSGFVCDIQTRTGDNDQFSIPITVSSGVAFALRVSVSTGRVATVFVNDVQVGTPVTLPAADGTKDFGFIHAVGDGTNDQVITDNLVFTAAGTGGGTGNPVRTTNIIAVCSRDVFMGDLTHQGIRVTGGSNAIALHAVPQGCYFAGKYYFVDGNGPIKQLDLATKTMETFTETAGTAPQDATICCVWRGRLVVGDGFLFFFSRVGDPHDWDYGQDDAGAAFSGSDAIAGHIGQPLLAFIPITDDQLVLGGDHDIHIMRGDPKAGGSIDLISDAIGILGPKSWCKSPDGTIYLLGTGGLFRWTPGSRTNPLPVCISAASWNQKFKDIDRGRTVTTLVWDRDRHGMHIYLTPGKVAASPPIHLWYDERCSSDESGAALFPLQVPDAQGPLSAIVYDGDGANDRVPILGGRDGYLRQWTNTAVADDGTAITSYVQFGPFPLGDSNNDGIVSRVNLILGDPATGSAATGMNAQVTVKTGLNAYDVTEGTAKHQIVKTFPGLIGRVTPIRAKLRGSYGLIEIREASIDKQCSFEQMSVDIEQAGLTRR